MRLISCLLMSTVAFSGLAKPFDKKRFKKEKSHEKKGWDLCTFLEGKGSYFYIKPQGYILGYLPSDKIIASEGGWAPGAGASLGIDIGKFDWRIDLAWEYNHASPYQSYSATGIRSLINAASYTLAEQWLDIKINRLLFLWSCEVNLFNRFKIRPKGGTEALWLHQGRHLRYTSGGTSVDSFGKNNFSGYGSCGGMSVRYRLGRGFVWVGDTLFSLLWGHFRTQGDFTYNDTSVAPAVHLKSGLEWERAMPSGFFQIGALYEVHHYFSQGQARYGSPPIQPIDTDFNAAGPSLYVRVCF